MLQNVTLLVRTVVLVSCVSLAGWWTMFIREQLTGHRRDLEVRDERIDELTDSVLEREKRIDDLGVEIEEKDLRIETLGEELEEAQARVEELEVSMWLLKVNHRVARVEVLDQRADPERPGQLITTVRIHEIGTEGEPVGPEHEVEIQGKVLYVEGLVVKFEDDFVEGADLLRGTSVALFKRVFSENQPPSEGYAIDRPRMHPLPHRGDDIPDPFYEELWERFWDYANDPDLAASKGVRAIHGEAPSIELRPGKSYRIELRASGGLTIKAE